MVQTVRAQCIYFRVSYKLLTCAPAEPAAKTRAPEPVPQELLDLQATDERDVLQVACACDYSLVGSDPRCDLDRTEEITSFLGGDNASAACRRGKSLCRDLCPKRWP